MLLAAVLPALLAMVLSMQWIDFPFFYHTDEPGKVRQVAENTRNLHHPPLMLDLAALAARPGDSKQEIVVKGRMVSVLSTTLAVFFLAAAMARTGGPATGLLAGLLLAVQPDVQEYTRYFKEDPLLLAGICAVFAAMTAHESRPRPLSAILLGMAAAFAASGKYVGVVMWIPAIALLASTRASRTHWTGFVLALAATWLALNTRLWMDPGTFQASLGKETRLVIDGQADVTRPIPHAGFLQRLGNRALHVAPFYLLGLGAAWTGWQKNVRSPGAGDAQPGAPLTLLILSSWPLLLALLLSFSAKDSGRYFLPASAGIAAATALGIATLYHILTRRTPRLAPVLTGLAAVLAIAASLARTHSYLDGFRRDPRHSLVLWCRQHLPPEARIVQGRKVGLPDGDPDHTEAWGDLAIGFPVTTSTRYLPDLAASPAELAALGFTHAALAGDEFERYLRTDQKPKKGRENDYLRRQRFYQDLFARTPVWSSPAGKVGTHQPALRLYTLPAPQ